MMKSWSYILKYYEDLAKDKEWEEFAAMDKFVKNLTANRELNGLYAVTSHETLVINKSEDFEQWFNSPSIYVELNFGASEEYLYKFTFAEPLEHNEIIRTKEETVLCSFEKSLEVFDEMIEKLTAGSK